MSEHTNGLLALFRNGKSVGSADGTGVCEVWPRDENGFPGGEGRANARRIVACWNLLDGYDTVALEGVTLSEFVDSHPELAEKAIIGAYTSLFAERGATNYLEVKGARPELGPFTITLQRAEGLTPVEKLDAMTKQRDVLLEALNGVMGVMNNSQGVAGWHQNGATGTENSRLLKDIRRSQPEAEQGGAA
ncbi:hypothetical protein [Aeromonas sp. ASNIH2]|uniref:hypothetical protein n=1 Tax=Aeromonas sp. ASNIH2 TaxID=1636607 RepID=UPI000CDBC542|nr:hypothetical protein [Aeromonas sp. ASNIH2]AUY11124.1 hypothetical protein C3F36_17680 [Aeromonas sp. ASNIH2]